MNIRHLTFRLLQVYIAVIRSGSFSRAAQELHLSQPTVSLQIKRLTEAIGHPLIETREGLYTPTLIGKELYHAAMDALTRFDDFKLYLNDTEHGIKGHFSLGIVTTAKYVVPRLLSPYAQQYPGVDVTLNIGNRESILKRFENQLDDLYLFSHPPTGNNVISGRFLRNPLVLIAPTNHWVAQRTVVDFSELIHERFLMREPGSATRMVTETWLRDNNIQLTNTLQIESNEAIRLSVETGLGLAIISEHTLAQAQAKLAIIPVTGLPLLSYWYVVRTTDKRLPAAAYQFLEFMNTHLHEWIEKKYIQNELSRILI